MGGGLIQLVAYGAQDVYLTGQPQTSYFKDVYRRYTNFAMEDIEQVIQGDLQTGGRTVQVNISRDGDLLSDVYLQIPVGSSYESPSAKMDAFRIVKWAELEIGGQYVDRIYGDWMNVWGEISLRKTPSQRDRLESCLNTHGGLSEHLYIPLLFWFHGSPGLALPLVALQYHDVKISFELDAGVSAPAWRKNFYEQILVSETRFFASYVYLDTTERRKFAEGSHEYLIHQLQREEYQITSAQTEHVIDLHFNHPTKYIGWIVNDDSTADKIPVIADGEYEDAKIVTNGQDRVGWRGKDYFQKYQLFQHFDGCCPSTRDTLDTTSIKPSVYSFSIRASDMEQPSGSCNFSRIDNTQLHIRGVNPTLPSTGGIVVFGQNYNVLRVVSGMGGLAYSN